MTTYILIYCDGPCQFRPGEFTPTGPTKRPSFVRPPVPEGWIHIYDEHLEYGTRPDYHWLCPECAAEYKLKHPDPQAT